METYTVSFFGHREVENYLTVWEQVEDIVKTLLERKIYVEFLVGKNGQFDEIASGAIHKIKRIFRDDNSCHTLVLPYLTAEYKNNSNYFEDFYDLIEVCDSSYSAHFKRAIEIRNREMIDRSDLVVFYLKESRGGAFKAYKYALKQDKKIVILEIS